MWQLQVKLGYTPSSAPWLSHRWLIGFPLSNHLCAARLTTSVKLYLRSSSRPCRLLQLLLSTDCILQATKDAVVNVSAQTDRLNSSEAQAVGKFGLDSEPVDIGFYWDLAPSTDCFFVTRPS